MNSIECEFFMGLSRCAAGCPIDRLTLAAMAVAEAPPAVMRAP